MKGWGADRTIRASVIRDILRPELDPVRATDADDPDGGDADGAPDPEPVGSAEPVRV